MNKTLENARLLDLASAGEKWAEEELVKENMGLVRSIAVRFTGRGQELEDLMQIGSLGLIKAVRGYDKSFGTAFSTYAVPLISGEIKRFLRDDGLIKVSREAKRNYAILMKEKEKFILNHGTEPKLSELCEICGMDKESALYAMEACSATVSINEKIGGEDGVSIEEMCSNDDVADITERIALKETLENLDNKEKNLIYLRYFKGMTQSEVAKRLGVTQVKISRMEKKIREEMRNKLTI